MNILDFERWSDAVNEGIDAKIEDDEDAKDEIEIDAPNKDNTIKYVVNGDEVKMKKIVSTDNGEQEEENIVNDKTLEDDIIDAVDKINDIKNRVEAEELRRLTGGDKSNATKEIKKIYKQNKENKENNNRPSLNLFTDPDLNNFFENSQSGDLCHFDISDKNGKYDIDKSYVYNKIKPKKGVGKGEYLLPLIFDDVYKQKIYGEDTKGDNYILHGNNKYILELKSPGSPLNFKNDVIKYIEDNLKITKSDKNIIYKKAITSTILKYAKNQKHYGNWENFYMCIFGKTIDKNNTPKDVIFINFSTINDNDIDPNKETTISKNIFELIEIENIDSYTKGKSGKLKKDIAHSFSFTYNDNKIYCKLKSEIIQNESIILSRDNFINEIYTK
jgi:hypothetical protein